MDKEDVVPIQRNIAGPQKKKKEIMPFAAT